MVRINGRNEDKMLDEMLKWKSTLLVEEAKKFHGDNLNPYEYNCHPMLEWGNKERLMLREVKIMKGWWTQEKDIQENDEKKAKNKQNRARNGKDKVKSKPKKTVPPSSSHDTSAIVVPPGHILTTIVIPVDVPCPKLRKSKKESHPYKLEPSTNEKLQMIHMDLCGPMRVESINKKRYILVIVDDYSRFTWVMFLRTKDEAPEVIIKILKQAQVSLNATVRYLRTGNDIEFLNQTLRNFTEEVGITHHTSTTPEVVAAACYTQNCSLIHTRYNKTLYELLIYLKPELKYLHVFGVVCYPTNYFEDLGKLHPNVDIGIFIGYLPSKKAYRIYNKRTRQIMETINVQFDELTQMDFEQLGSGPDLHGLTSRHISLGLVLNQAVSTSAKPPTKNNWDLLFQPMFKEYFKSTSSVSTPISVATLLPSDTARASSSSSTYIDKNAPSPSNSPNIKATNSPINSTNVSPNKEVAVFDSDTFTNPFAPPNTSSAESSSRIVDTSNMYTFQQHPIYTKRWTKDHPLVTIIGDPSKPVSTRCQLSTDALCCYFHAFLAKAEPKNYKEAMEESCWIEAMQEEIYEFERIEVWELVPRPDKAMIINLNWIFKKRDQLENRLHQSSTPIEAFRIILSQYATQTKISVVLSMDVNTRNFTVTISKWRDIVRHQRAHSLRGIFINKSKYALEMLKKYGFEKCDVVDNPMVGHSKLDEDSNGTPVDPTRYREMVESIMYLTASLLDLVFAVCMCARYKAKPTENHLITVAKIQGKMRSQLTDYGFDYNKIPFYSDSKSAIALSCNTMQHSRTKHIAVRYHFIKEKVENEVVELYFVKTDCQLADIFTKALARERFKFLIKCLGMQSITPEELKRLAKLDEE
ncbi:putative ribonuclease H-like domain-containing protein [Tanacetum coccineum]